jgi:hypothetical protein
VASLSDPRGLDEGIKDAVLVLRAAGVETYESCEGCEGHAYPQPCVRFFGTDAAGWKALAVALTARLPVKELVRVWTIRSDQPHGPYWELRLKRPTASPRNAHTEASCSFRCADSPEESVARSDSPQRCDERPDHLGESSDTAQWTESP